MSTGAKIEKIDSICNHSKQTEARKEKASIYIFSRNSDNIFYLF